MTENLLHYICKYHCFSPHKLKTQSGNNLKIIKIGSHNHNAGPDFEQAKLMPVFQQKALNILGELSAENNVIIRKFKQRGITPDSTVHSQAFLQLKESYCDVKKCLNCSVGKHWIN